MWQFTKTAIISGLSQPIDLNLAYFGYDGIEAPRDSNPPEEVGPDPEALMTFTEVEETVTAKEKTNLRSIPDQGESSKILFTLLNGQTAQRTATSPSGWSRLLYNGQVCHAVTNYLTTDLDYDPAAAQGGSDGLNTQFETANDRVTAKEKVNLRSMPSVDNPDSQVVAELKNGDFDCIAVAKGNGDAIIASNPEIAQSGFFFEVDEKYTGNVVLLQKGNDAMTEAVNEALDASKDEWNTWYEEAKAISGIESSYDDEGNAVE